MLLAQLNQLLSFGNLNPLQDLNLDMNSHTDFSFHTFIKERSGTYLACNDMQAHAVGFNSSNDVIGLCDFDMFIEEEAQIFRSNDQEVLKTEQAKIIMEPFTNFAKKPMMATSIKSPLRNKNKKVIGVVGMCIIQENKLVVESTNELSARQIDCLYYLVKGMTIKQIAKTLNLSHRTVEHYLDVVKVKLNCESRVDLFSKALLIPEIEKRLFKS